MRRHERPDLLPNEELARHTLGRTRRKIFDIPSGDPLSNFEVILKRVNEFPLETDPDGNMSLTASFQDGNTTRRLTTSTRSHRVVDKNNDDKKKPQLIHLPLYDPTLSMGTYRFFDDGDFFQEWEHKGIDISHDSEDIRSIHESARTEQYGYALSIRMVRESIRAAKTLGQPVGLLGISYGGNIIGAFLYQAEELPDAVVVIAGGSIYETMLGPTFSGDMDAGVVTQLRDFLPRQNPVSEKFARRCAVVINSEDERVRGQESLWGSSAKKLLVAGSHASAIASNKDAIRVFARDHLASTLSRKI